MTCSRWYVAYGRSSRGGRRFKLGFRFKAETARQAVEMAEGRLPPGQEDDNWGDERYTLDSVCQIEGDGSLVRVYP